VGKCAADAIEEINAETTMGDPEARAHMLFIAEAYKLLAERAKERSERLAAPSQ